jgi:autotransporter-associated beta strand protein
MVPAGNDTDLTNDLKNATAGETIRLEGGTYDTGISTSISGTPAAPITVEGENGATLSNTTGTGEGIEVNNNYYIFQNININGFQESFRTDGASYGVADNINATGSAIESFKFKNTSQHWLVENCSVSNSGMEGYYVGDASQNWTGGVPDQSGYITFYHDTDFVNGNDGFDDKEGSHDIRIIDCSVNWNNTVPGANDEGDSGVYNRATNVTVINLNVVNNGSAGNAERFETATVNGITYGSGAIAYGVVANNIHDSFVEDTQPSVQLYDNFSLTNVAGGMFESGSKIPSEPSPSTFVEPTWSGTDGQFLPINMTWDNSLSAVGNGTTWDYNQQNFNDTGIPVIFFQGVNVTFNDNNSGNYGVTLNTVVSPGSMTVSNSLGNYAISGTGAIGGTGSLTKSGGATLTLSTANAYTGGTNINGGVLNVGNTGALGVTGVISFGGGTLQYSSSNTVDYSARLSTAADQAYSVDTSGLNVTWATALTSSGGSLAKLGTGTLTLSGPNTYTGGTTVTGGKLLIDPTSSTTSALPKGALAISGSGIVQLADNVAQGNPFNRSNVVVTSLSLTGNGTLDIGNNRIIIDYTSGNDPIASIASWIKNGFSDGETAGANPAIISSDVASDDIASGLSYGIGYADGADGAIVGLTSGEIEIMYTLLGDANLDGTVNSEDFTPFSTNLGQPGGWDKGDFNYDGIVNSEDFTSFSHNLNQSASLACQAEVLDGANSISLTNLPEPACAGIMVVAGLGILQRRRRSSAHPL